MAGTCDEHEHDVKLASEAAGKRLEFTVCKCVMAQPNIAEEYHHDIGDGMAEVRQDVLYVTGGRVEARQAPSCPCQRPAARPP